MPQVRSRLLMVLSSKKASELLTSEGKRNLTDEIIGAAHLIRALMRRGTRVRVVVVTDGAASHPHSPAWPRARLIAERQRESRRALGRLGVAAGSISFLGLPDGGLSDAPKAQAAGAVRRAIRSTRRLDMLVGPAEDDAHPDHRWVSVVLADVQGVRRRLAYRVWPPRRITSGRARCLIGQRSGAAKRSLIAIYRTQSGAIRDDPGGFAIAPHELAVFAHPVERFVAGRR